MSTTAHDPAGKTITRRAAVTALGFGSAALLAACAAPSPTPTTAPAKPPTAPSPAPTPAPTIAAQPAATAVAKPPPAPSPAPKPTQAPAKPQVAKIVIGQPTTGLAFSPIAIAQSRKFFEDEAIEMDMQLFQTNALLVASLLSGGTQFIGIGSNSQFETEEKGLGCVSVAGFPSSVLLGVAARNDYLRQKGATPRQPLKDKVNALKGAKVAVPSLSGTPVQFAAYALKTNGLDPERDVEFIGIPGGPPRISALREGQIDAFVGGVPDPEIAEFEGFASVFIDLGEEVPAFKSLVYEVLIGQRSWVEQNAGVTERFCRAIGRGNNLIVNDLPAAKDAIKLAFPQISPQVLDVAMERIKPKFSPDARMTEEMWKNASDVYLVTGAIKSTLPVAEGLLWTNKYLTNVPKR